MNLFYSSLFFLFIGFAAAKIVSYIQKKKQTQLASDTVAPDNLIQIDFSAGRRLHSGSEAALMTLPEDVRAKPLVFDVTLSGDLHTRMNTLVRLSGAKDAGEVVLDSLRIYEWLLGKRVQGVAFAYWENGEWVECELFQEKN